MEIFAELQRIRPGDCIRVEHPGTPQQEWGLYTPKFRQKRVGIPIPNVQTSGTAEGCFMEGGLGYYDPVLRRPAASCWVGKVKASGPTVCINALGVVYLASPTEDPLHNPTHPFQ